MPSEELAREIEEAAEQVAAEHEEELKELRDEQGDEQGGETDTKTGDTQEDQVSDDTGEEDSGESGITSESEPDDGDVDDIQDGEADGESEEQGSEQLEPSPVPNFSDEVLSRAINVGLSLGKALSFPDEAALDRVVSTAEQAIAQADSKEAKQDDVDPFAALKLDPERYEPEVVEMFDKMREVLQGQQQQIEGFKQQQEQIAQSSQMAAAREVEQWFDKQVESLGEDFVDTLGTGGHNSLDRGSPQFVKREQIAEHMSVLLAGYQAQGQQAPPREELFETAARSVLADKYQELHEKRLAGDLARRKGAHLQRVNRSKAKPKQSVEEETAAMLDERFG